MIRLAELKDIDRIIVLLQNENNINVKSHPDIFIRNKTKYTEEELKEIIKTKSKIIYVYADDNDEVLGYIVCTEHVTPKHNNMKSNKTLYLDSTSIDPVHQREGIGTKLFLRAVKHAKDNGFFRITLSVWSNNDATNNLVKSLSLSPTRTTYEYIV